MSNEFGSLDIEAMQGEDTRLNTQAGGNNFLDQFVPMPEVKPGQTGAVNLRILPPVKGGRLFQYNRVHTMNDRKVHCPRPLSNGKWDWKVKCPVCDYYSSLWKQADKLDKAGHGAEADTLKEEARSIKPVERYYYNAVVRQLGDEKNVGPRILSVGKILHKMIIRAIVGDESDPDSKLGNITDLKNGYDFIIRKEVTPGEGFPKYDRSGFARNPSPTGNPDEIAAWVENLHDLTKLRNPKEVDYLEKELAIHRGLIKDDSVGFDTEEFDAKWASQASDEVKELMDHNPGGVSVPADVPSETTEAPAAEAPSEPAPAETTTAAKTEDVPIEDEDFLKQLNELENGA